MSTDSLTQMFPQNTLASDPDGDIVDGLFQGFAQFLILENALKTDLLDNIDNESSPVSVETLSTKYGYNSDVLERLLDTLTCMRLISKHNDAGEWKYSNTRTTSVYLTKGSEFYKGDVLMADKILIGNTSSSLIQTLKTGPRNQMEKFITSGKMTTINANNNVTNDQECETLWYQDNDNVGTTTNTTTTTTTTITTATNTNTNTNNNNNQMPLHKQQQQQQTTTNGDVEHNKSCTSELQTKPSVKVLMKSMDAMMYSCRHAIPRTFDLSQHRVAVDLGGGTGFLSRLLTESYLNLTATVFELPHVVATARSLHQHSDGVGGRVTFLAGNFFRDDIPPADLYILSRVLHCWDETHCQNLLKKIYRKLPPGGKLLIMEKFLNDRKDGPMCIMNLHLNMSSISHGRERTAKEYQSLVEDQGFTDTHVRVIGGVNVFDALLTCKPF